MTQSNHGIRSTVDPDTHTAVDARVQEMARGAPASATIAAMLALGSLPIALGALAKDVYGQAPSDVVDVLQFALLLEYLESDFYQRGVNATGLIPASDRTVFSTIGAHEATHVVALQALITRKGAAPRSKPTFDYTAKGAIPGFAFLPTQYATFTALAQAFEDTGVRAYKGQVGRLITDKAVHTTALSIHSVEARHASEVRRLRGKKGWIASNSRDDLPAFTQGIYDGEENTTHAGINVTTVAANFGGAAGATVAFDEPLTMAQVMTIVSPFLV